MNRKIARLLAPPVRRISLSDLNAYMLGDVIKTRGEKQVSTVVLCRCDKCNQGQRFRVVQKLRDFVAAHNLHGTLEFNLFDDNGLLLCAWGSFG